MYNEIGKVMMFLKDNKHLLKLLIEIILELIKCIKIKNKRRMARHVKEVIHVEPN